MKSRIARQRGPLRRQMRRRNGPAYARVIDPHVFSSLLWTMVTTAVFFAWLTFLWSMVHEPYGFLWSDISDLKDWALAPVVGSCTLLGLLGAILVAGLGLAILNFVRSRTPRRREAALVGGTLMAVVLLCAALYATRRWHEVARSYDNDAFVSSDELRAGLEARQAIFDEHADRVDTALAELRAQLEAKQLRLESPQYHDAFVRDWQWFNESSDRARALGPLRGFQLGHDPERFYVLVARQGVGEDTRVQGYCRCSDQPAVVDRIARDLVPPKGTERLVHLERSWYAFDRHGVFDFEYRKPRRY